MDDRRREQKRAASARYHDRNRERRTAEASERGKAAFAALSPEEKLERGRRNREREGAEVRRVRARAEHARLRVEVLAAYGDSCECCGTEFAPHLTLDHVGGGGTVERRSAPGQMLFRRLRREGFPSGYRVLCWNCNWAAHQLGRCPCSDPAH